MFKTEEWWASMYMLSQISDLLFCMMNQFLLIESLSRMSRRFVTEYKNILGYETGAQVGWF
jgi:hypothetical protein